MYKREHNLNYLRNYLLILLFLFLSSMNLFSQNIILNDSEKQWLANNPNIKLLAPLGHEPALFKNYDGKVVGILDDYFTAISKEIGQKIDFKYYDTFYENPIELSKNKSIYGTSTLFKIPKYEDIFYFSKPYMHTPFIIFTSKNRHEDIKNKNDLKYKTIAILKNNYAGLDYINEIKGTRVIFASSISEQLKLLQYEKVDAILGYTNYHYLINKFLYDNIYPAFNAKEAVGVSIAILKEHEKFISILNKAIDNLSETKKQSILSKWLNTKEKVSLNLSEQERKYLNENPVLKTISLKDYPPFNFSQNGKAMGYTVDYVKLMTKKLGVKVEFIKDKTWSEYLLMLKNNEIDFIPHIAKTKSRESYVDFTNFTHITYNVGMAINKNVNISSLSDLNGKVIAVQKNNFLHEYLKNNLKNVKFLFVKNNQEAIDALTSNKVSVAVGSIPALDYYIKKNWLSNIKTSEIKDIKIDTKFNLPMGVTKNNDILKSILEKVNNSISHTKESEIKQKWISLNDNYLKQNILTDYETTYLENKKEIRMCIDPNWMPFEKNEDGKHIGMSADYIKILQKQIKVPIVHVPTVNWTESLLFGKQKKCDIFSLVMPTDERRKYLNFTKSYLNVPLIIATSIDEFFINDISNVIDKKVGIVKGYAYVEILKEKYPNINLVEVENINVGLQKVSDKELFAFIGSLSTVGYAIQKNYIGEIKIAGKFKDTWDLGIGVRNDEPVLVNIFNKAIDTISEKQHQEILNKWVSVNYQKGTDLTILIQIVSVFILILVFILYKSRSIKQLNKKLLEANREINEQQAMVNKYVLIVTTDLKGVITDVNEAYCSHTGYSKEDLIGKKHNVMRHPDMQKKFFSKMWADIRNNKTWVGEIKNFTKDDQVCWLNTYIEPIIKDSEKIGYRSICEDITDKKRIEELSITDKLTGLYNRLKLDEILSQQIDEYKRYKHPFSIILLDIDNFKQINDHFGHDIGDNILEEIAKRLKLNIRTTDVVGRWGGEEFVVICKNTESDNGLIVAEHLRELIETIPFDTVGRKTVSLGITEFKEDDTLSSVFKRADQALYEAKNSGKNRSILI